MTSNPPPYLQEESKGLYPAVQCDPQQQQQPVVYPQQGAPVAPTAPVMSSVTYYPQAPQQQQNQPLVISTQPTPVVVAPQQHAPTLICQIVTSYFTSICCCCPCGFIAFILAMCGLSRASYNPASARSCGTASIVFSVIAIVLGVIFIIILIVGKAAVIYDIPGLESVKFPGSSEDCEYTKNGRCYSTRSQMSESRCHGKLSITYYSDGYCYYN